MQSLNSLQRVCLIECLGLHVWVFSQSRLCVPSRVWSGSLSSLSWDVRLRWFSLFWFQLHFLVFYDSWIMDSYSWPFLLVLPSLQLLEFLSCTSLHLFVVSHLPPPLVLALSYGELFFWQHLLFWWFFRVVFLKWLRVRIDRLRLLKLLLLIACVMLRCLVSACRFVEVFSL